MKTYNEPVGKTKNGVTIYRVRYVDTAKNLAYVEKRWKLAWIPTEGIPANKPAG